MSLSELFELTKEKEYPWPGGGWVPAMEQRGDLIARLARCHELVAQMIAEENSK
jgi:hypothetical protein